MTDSILLAVEVLIFLVGIAGVLMVLSACREAASREDAARAENRLRIGLRLSGAGMFAIVAVDLFASVPPAADRYAFAYYTLGYVALGLAVYVPLIRHVWRRREACGWGQWPSRLPY